MVDKLKVINFLQDFGCARLNQLQILYGDANNNFNNVLNGNMVSKKETYLFIIQRKLMIKC